MRRKGDDLRTPSCAARRFAIPERDEHIAVPGHEESREQILVVARSAGRVRLGIELGRDDDTLDTRIEEQLAKLIARTEVREIAFVAVLRKREHGDQPYSLRECDTGHEPVRALRQRRQEHDRGVRRLLLHPGKERSKLRGDRLLVAGSQRAMAGDAQYDRDASIERGRAGAISEELERGTRRGSRIGHRTRGRGVRGGRSCGLRGARASVPRCPE